MMQIPGLVDGNNTDDFGENKLAQWQGRFDQHALALYGGRQGHYGFPFNGPSGFTSGGMIKDVKKPVWVVIDRVSRVAFPIAFVIFNCSYWPYLLIGSSKQ